MRRYLLAFFIIASLAVTPAFSAKLNVGLWPQSNIATVEVDTFTWVWVNSFDTGVATDTHESPFVPAFAEIDSFIKDTDGSRHKYGVTYLTTPSTLNYQNNLVRNLFASREDQYPTAAQYQPFSYWSFEDIPDGARIISAVLTKKLIIGDTIPPDPVTQYVAVIDTSSTNFNNYSAGDIRTGPDNVHYHEPAWAYSDVGATALWSFDLDDVWSLWGGDYGWSILGYSSVILKPNSSVTSGWVECDLTATVAKYHEAGLSDKLLWFFGDGRPAGIFRYAEGPNATDPTITQPVLTVVWETGTEIPGVDFAVFSDNHSNSYAVSMMGDAMDGDGFSPRFMIHNGDMNLGIQEGVADTVIANQDTLADQWQAIPMSVVAGNHEGSVDNGATFFGSVIPTANRAFFDELPGLGGQLTKMGAKDNFEMRNRNFSYDIGGVHLVQMDFENSTSGIDSTTAQDIRWLESDLESSAATVKIVFFHRPFLEVNDVDFPGSSPGESHDPSPGWEALQLALEDGGVDAVFSGHTHLAWHSEVNGVDYFNTPSTGDFPTQADQGFMTVSVSALGSGSVKLYRGKNADGAYSLTQVFTF